jgi:putative transposase
MIRVLSIPCQIPRDQADSLNRESGRIYTATMVWHYRIFRRTKHWFSMAEGCKYNDGMYSDTILHAHSRDAAQQGFYEACKTAKALKIVSETAHYPHKRKWYRTTTWKNTGIKVVNGRMRLSLAKGQPHIFVDLPKHLHHVAPQAFRQVELVYEKAHRRYQWHISIDEGQTAPELHSEKVVAVDLGEIHPAAMTDGETTTIITCRELRSIRQYTNKRLAELSEVQSHFVKHSRRWWRVQRRRNQFLAEQRNRIRDLEHKISHAVVATAQEMGAGVLAIGDVRDIADNTKTEKRLNRENRQKISNWSHGKQRTYIAYKAAAVGITTELVPEPYTSKTCPQCGHLNKPKGRNYTCSQCGFVGHRDCVGSSNILSRKLYGELAKVLPPTETKYRYPFTGKRSPRDQGQVARASEKDVPVLSEASTSKNLLGL